MCNGTPSRRFQTFQPFWVHMDLNTCEVMYSWFRAVGQAFLGVEERGHAYCSHRALSTYCFPCPSLSSSYTFWSVLEVALAVPRTAHGYVFPLLCLVATPPEFAIGKNECFYSECKQVPTSGRLKQCLS